MKINQNCYVKQEQGNAYVFYQVNAVEAGGIKETPSDKQVEIMLLQKILSMLPQPRMQNLYEAAIRAVVQAFPSKAEAAEYLGISPSVVYRRYPTKKLSLDDKIKKITGRIELESEQMGGNGL